MTITRGRQALGRSLGGLTPKTFLACDGEGAARWGSCDRPQTSTTAPRTAATAAIRGARLGPGRPGVRPGHLVADKDCETGPSAPGCANAASAPLFPNVPAKPDPQDDKVAGQCAFWDP